MKVAFFPGCMVDMFYPEVGIAAVNVLERLGCEVELPDDHVCCGQPFTNSGYIEEAKPMMKKVIDAYSKYDTIVSLTGSCAWAIKAEYPHFFEDDKEYSQKIAELAPRIFRIYPIHCRSTWRNKRRSSPRRNRNLPRKLPFDTYARSKRAAFDPSQKCRRSHLYRNARDGPLLRFWRHV